MVSPSDVRQLRRVPPIDYTSRDYRAVKADLLRSVPFKTREWTDLNDSDLGVVLLDLLAHSADVLHFYLDRNANEAFLPTAITRRSVINLLKLIDYRLRSAAPASVDLTFTTPPQVQPLLIPKGTKCQTAADTTGGPIFFETAEDLTIPVGETEGTVGAVEGETKEELLAASEGIPNQRIALEGNPIVDGSLELFVDEGIGFELWTEVSTFAFSTETSREFTARRDENESVTIFLGDGVQGKVPTAGSPMKARYRLGGGARGNVGASTITAVVTPITLNATPVAVEVTNEESASGGEERQSIEEAKILGPRSIRTLDRAVSPEDFETLAEQFPGVAKARLGTASPPLACCCELALLIAPEGGGPPSSVLKSDLLAHFDERMMAATCLRIVDPEYVPVDVTGTVFVASNFTVDAVALETAGRLAAFFDLKGEFVDFGTPIFLSDVVRLIDEIPGVDHVDMSKLTRRAEPEKQIWRPNGADFQPVVAGDPAVETCEEALDETWTVTFVGATQFTLKDGSGAVVGTFDVGQGVPCSATGDRVQFKLVAGTTAMCPGDRGTFRTSPRFSNVPIAEGEIPIQGAVNLTFVGGAKAQRPCP